jgi:hypothetical protein
VATMVSFHGVSPLAVAAMKVIAIGVLHCVVI